MPLNLSEYSQKSMYKMGEREIGHNQRFLAKPELITISLRYGSDQLRRETDISWPLRVLMVFLVPTTRPRGAAHAHGGLYVIGHPSLIPVYPGKAMALRKRRLNPQVFCDRYVLRGSPSSAHLLVRLPNNDGPPSLVGAHHRLWRLLSEEHLSRTARLGKYRAHIRLPAAIINFHPAS